MYVTMGSILEDAHKNNYGVMAVNCINMEMAEAVIEAADEMNSPVIIQIGPGQMRRHADPEVMLEIVKILARRANVPVALNLDHGNSLDICLKCINLGYSNIMIDASSFDFEENVKRTQIVSTLAHAKGISVEAELGHVGQAVNGDGNTDDYYTNVEQAVEFVKLTGVDALAVAIGTAHGNYPKGKIPVLDFTRLVELKKALNIPLVLHGGSGSGEENLRKAVACGINKINVCTDAFSVAKDGFISSHLENENRDFLDLMIQAQDNLKKFVKEYIQIIGSDNRYTFSEKKQQVHE